VSDGDRGRAVGTSRDSVVDQASVRRTNLARVLGEVRRPGPHSRAAIAARTGLTKATVSSLVAELIERGLVRETGRRQEGSVGRPGRLLELDGGAVAVLGLEVNAHYLAVRAIDLADRVLVDRRVAFDAVHAGSERAINELARLALDALAGLGGAGAGLVGIGVAVPGLVDVPSGRVLYAPNLLWQDVPIAEFLRARLVLPERVSVVVDNEANLSALAEFRHAPDAAPDLVYLTGETGIGAGLVVGGQLLRGSDGFSGEIGHIPVDPCGETCGCGRIGCLETKIGLAAAIRAAAPDLADEVADPQQQAQALLRRAETGDPRTLEGFDEIGRWLGIGISILVNMLNPGAVVLGGYFATVAPYVVPTAMRELRARAVAGDAAICRIAGSTFGFTAAVRGGTSVIIEQVLQDPLQVPAAENVAQAAES
jgi:predicted NBD/HSP70 family sugar kinase